MTCNKCLEHRKVIKAAMQQRDVGKVTSETLSAGRTAFEKIGSKFGRAFIKKRKE